MEIPQEVFEHNLSKAERLVISALYQTANGRGIADIRMELLGSITNYSREHLRRTIRSLEMRGLLVTTRKKRNLGYLHRNVYQLKLLPTYSSSVPKDVASVNVLLEKSIESLNVASVEAENVASVDLSEEKFTQDLNVASTDVYIANDSLTTSSLINTSYLLKVRYAHKSGKEIKMGKWNWQEDDNLGSVGLFDEELLEKVEPKKVNRRDPRTRNTRPDYDWTTADVAAEFGERLRRRFPQLPALVNTQKLAVILAKYRRELSTNALIELELMKIFFEDEKNLTYVARMPEKAMGAYLTLFKSRLADVLERLSMGTIQRNTDPEVAVESNFVYATDGTRFENTLVGRKALQRYEERLTTQP